MSKGMIKVKTGPKRYYIVKESGNWADEFDIEGFTLEASHETPAAFKKRLVDDFEAERGIDGTPGAEEYPVECYFGTNEAIEFNDRAEVEAALDIKELTKAEYDAIKKHVGESFGMTVVC